MANTTNLDLVKPLGTDHALISQINSNMDKIDAYAGNVNSSLNSLGDGLAIIANGDTHAAITAGQFVYVRGHNTLAEGLYTATTNIAANGALSTSNLQADGSGGLNSVYASLNNRITSNTVHTGGIYTGDANALFVPGVYRCVSGSITNVPGNEGFLIVLPPYSTTEGFKSCVQKFVVYTGEEYTRANWAATSVSWSSWEQLALNSKTPKIEYRTLTYYISENLVANETLNITIPLSPSLPFTPIGAIAQTKERNIMYVVTYFDLSASSITIRVSAGKNVTDLTTPRYVSVLFIG